MYYFFISKEQIIKNQVIMVGSDVNHIANVLRIRVGEKIMLSTGEDEDYLCKILRISKEEIILDIIEKNKMIRELPVKVTLYQGLPKSDKMEWIIQKAVELGIYRIVPIQTKRTIIKWDIKKEKNKITRWQAISEAAAKQSKRQMIPKIENVLAFSTALEEVKKYKIKCIPYEFASQIQKTREILKSVKAGDNIAIFIGPEGGFEEYEIEMAKERGVIPITLGKRILRTETAGLVMMSNIMLQMEE